MNTGGNTPLSPLPWRLDHPWRLASVPCAPWRLGDVASGDAEIPTRQAHSPQRAPASGSTREGQCVVDVERRQSGAAQLGELVSDAELLPEQRDPDGPAPPPPTTTMRMPAAIDGQTLTYAHPEGPWFQRQEVEVASGDPAEPDESAADPDEGEAAVVNSYSFSGSIASPAAIANDTLEDGVNRSHINRTVVERWLQISEQLREEIAAVNNLRNIAYVQGIGPPALSSFVLASELEPEVCGRFAGARLAYESALAELLAEVRQLELQLPDEADIAIAGLRERAAECDAFLQQQLVSAAYDFGGLAAPAPSTAAQEFGGQEADAVIAGQVVMDSILSSLDASDFLDLTEFDGPDDVDGGAGSGADGVAPHADPALASCSFSCIEAGSTQAARPGRETGQASIDRETLQEERDQLTSKVRCSICWAEEKRFSLLPCCHLTFCKNCLANAVRAKISDGSESARFDPSSHFSRKRLHATKAVADIMTSEKNAGSLKHIGLKCPICRCAAKAWLKQYL
mmetsp:Transcript_27783/g.70165  ORF Transcript_27783/g.70165 Transcript_27783/m.70165 type:complete len:513 (+) Transcript_27783:173-1711(+)|eukprot:CAMPEP_0178986148 /NCGR_PEP_ID=MMETSP0795-20121207/2550_1 /TAXON_ID=88552 /ORGANISM="Amoebophrya sp., Strain Ameob2" /LENGTH=512 /DNA_ID=CAMNT_0020677191 /DNA_START=151 /DNA_END=1689 /DNA_ORIENTATION=+